MKYICINFLQTQQLKLSLYHQTHSWQQTVSSVKSATRDSKGTKTCSCIDEATTCHGSWGKEQPLRSERGFTSAQNHHVFTTTQLVHWVISRASRSTFPGSTVRKSGNVISALRSMLCSLIGKLILKPVGLRSTNVTVAPSFPGFCLFL